MLKQYQLDKWGDKMSRKIFDLYKSAIERIEEACGIDVFSVKEETPFGCCMDVELDECAILKCWNDSVMIDLAGKKEFISFDEFSRMEFI